MADPDIRTTNIGSGPHNGGLHLLLTNRYRVIAPQVFEELEVTLEVGTWAEGDGDPDYGKAIPVTRQDLLDAGMVMIRAALEPRHWPASDPGLR